MQNNNAEQIEDVVLAELKASMADRVNNIFIKESTDIPHTMVSLDFEAYRFFNIRFNYDRGRFGCCIINGEYAIKLESSEKWFDKADMKKFFQDVRSNLELRIPEKYLVANNWQIPPPVPCAS